MRYLFVLVTALLLGPLATVQADGSLRIALFNADATPPIGSPLCNGMVQPVKEVVTPLSARGIVILGAEEPIVLCAFDWVGIANEGHDAFREALARAVGTSVERVTVHTLHQHDAPGSDYATEQLLAAHGLAGLYSNSSFDRDVMNRLAAAAKESLVKAQAITHIGIGNAKVDQVASNRRILGPNGRVILQRQSSGGKNPAAREAPEGTIDPLVRVIGFWNEGKPIAALTYYATHPQSYYGKGAVNWDFVGMARELAAESIPGVTWVHFNGAGGNVAAGKYNDGSKENRPALADRLADGMKRAWDSQHKNPVGANDVSWRVEPILLPVRDTLVEEQLLAKLTDTNQKQTDRIRAARDLTFLRRMHGGHRIPLSCLRVGPACVLHMPGELFIEYQLAAQAMRPDDFIAMAAYGDYGPGYIGTKNAYSQGGYETGIVSRTAPSVEKVLLDGIRKLLEKNQ